MHWRLLIATTLSTLLFGLAALAYTHTLPATSALDQAPRPVVTAYNLSPGVTAIGVYPDAHGGVWVQETNPVGLTHVAADAPPTGGTLPVQVVTTTLTGVVTDVTLFGRPASPVITVPLDVVTRPVEVVVLSNGAPTSSGIVEYVWPTVTHDGGSAWLSQPVSGTWDGAVGLWVHRAGALDFLDPATGLLTSFESEALGNVPAVLNADVPHAVWGLAPNRLFLVEPTTRTATVFLGTDVPAAVSHVTFQYGYYSVWFSDPARYGIVELMYHPAHPADQIRSVYQLPGLRQADDLVRVHRTLRVPISVPDQRRNPFAQCKRAAADADLWYLDRLHNRLGCLSMTTPYSVTEYDLPAPLALGDLFYTPSRETAPADGAQLWFTLVGETAAFDPRTGTLTRYQSDALPLVGVSGAGAWSAEADQVYRLLSRYLFYIPNVLIPGGTQR